MRLILTGLLLFCLFGTQAWAQEGQANHDKEPELAMGALSSVVIGFGTGSVFQQREKYRLVTYATTQGVGLLLLMLSMGDCRTPNKSCQDQKDFLATTGSILFLGSRLIEIVDSTYFFISHNNKTPVVGLNYEF